EQIRTIQPHGPYALGGFSYGGLVAFEMATQLRAKGEAVTMVALFDSVAINSGRSRLARAWSFLRNLSKELPSWLLGAFELTGPQWRHLIQLRMRIVKAKLAA